MNDRLTDDEIAFFRGRLAALSDRGERDVAVRIHRQQLMLDELTRQRRALSQIRKITDPDTDTMEAPMEAIRGVLEDV